MRFGERWRQWIIYCITAPMLPVLVNGRPTRQFGLERGLRQGDMLSPFLFNVAVEDLSALFRKAEELNLMKGAYFGSEAVHISHLHFTDDIILFLHLKVNYLLNAIRILRCYKLASGFHINFHSCVVKVGNEIENEVEWVTKFRFMKAKLPISYLGAEFDSTNRKLPRSVEEVIS
ncbi:hypothetical protein Ddye_013929 [Dipteronia dyeriana]|uniref:Reverse transcriptase domain-containing protein n=1 Tax=Dipteronia dyeriana TaxID=168575 RepID=A0AAE0CKN7_9ROSI|nr:hypothetical protein Ddye_013929 [Dipteronia dyeriana]